MTNGYTIALIGQTNVGKSTLFNALIEKQKAIISPLPGTTRDRNYGVCHWQNTALTIIDTGGIEPKGKRDMLSQEVKKHIQFAIDEADLIFFILEIHPVDNSGTKSLISNFDRHISRLIKRAKKPTFLVLNKADNPYKRSWGKSNSWKALGFGSPYAISSVNGSGVGDLLDGAIAKLIHTAKTAPEPIPREKLIKVAIIGKPNVGKSTLLNALLGQEKAIVSPLPHTTRGPQDTMLKTQGADGVSHTILLIDTAGIRKRAKIKTAIEHIGVKKSLDMIGQSHIVLFVLDIGEPINHQNKSLLRLIVQHKKGLIVIVNKCDRVSPTELKNLIQSKAIQKLLPGVSWAPFVFISAKKHTNIDMIFSSIFTTNQNYHRWVSTKKLNQFLKICSHEKKFDPNIWERIHIYQRATHPPTFALKIPKVIIRKKLIHPAQINIIEKELRKTWDFIGVPIEVKLG